MTFIMSVTFIGCELADLTAAGYLVVLVSPDGESPARIRVCSAAWGPPAARMPFLGPI